MKTTASIQFSYLTVLGLTVLALYLAGWLIHSWVGQVLHQVQIQLLAF